MAWLYVPKWYTRPKTVTHPSTNRAQRRVTSFMRRTLPLHLTTKNGERRTEQEAAEHCDVSTRAAFVVLISVNSTGAVSL